MARHERRLLTKLYRGLIAVIGVIVPRRLRADWRQEWEAELRYREALLAEWERLNWRTKLDLLRRSLGAFWDALLLQPKRLEDEMFQDLRYGARMLMKNPGFTLVAVLTLALGIGANTAIFSVVNALVLKPLPYDNPEQLVWVEEVSKTHPPNPVIGAHFLDWQEQCQTLERIAGYKSDYLSLTGAGEPERLEAAEVSANFFPLLRVQPFIGRNFLEAEDRADGEHVVILSHGLWQRRFGADQSMIGKTMRLDDESHTVIGVLPASFRYSPSFELWTPLALDPKEERGNQMSSMFSAVARLKPGVTREQARAEMETIRHRYETSKLSGMPFSEDQVRLTPLQEKMLGATRRALLVLFGAVGLILLIACANVANLMLARSAVRQKELAVRAALGAGRFRLVRQLLTESLLLAGGGGVAGLWLAYWLTKLLASFNPATSIGEMARLTNIAIDLRVLGFTLLVSLLTALFFGLLPALQLSRPDLLSALKEGGRGGGLHGSRVRSLLTVTEVALAVVLLVGAGLLMRSFVKLLDIDPGYRANDLLTACISLPPRYDEKPQRVRFYEQTLQHIAALPGVEAVGAISHLPLTNFNLGGWLRVENGAAMGQHELPVPIGAINPDYFRVMGIPLRAGRIFNDGDHHDAPRVVVISEALARKLFPNQDPLGRRLRVPGSGAPWTTIIGVVSDIHHQGLDKEIRPAVYLSYRQAPPGQMWLAMRGAVDPLSLAPAVRGAVRVVDPALPVYEVMTMGQRLADSVAARRFNLLLLGVFALSALLLASVGVYGVISYLVTQRTHEIGIRVALGAQAADVLRLFMRQGMALVGAGVVTGLLGALALTRVMASLLFGISATDPFTFAGVAVLLMLVALAACYLPARRAAKVNPLDALRHE